MYHTWEFFWEVLLSNAVVAVLLAIGVIALGRIWKRPAVIHLLWIFVVLKLFTPPLITWPVPAAIAPAFIGEPVATLANTGSSTTALDLNSTNAIKPSEPIAKLTAESNFETIAAPSAAQGVSTASIRNVSFTAISQLLLTIWLTGSLAILAFRATKLWRFNLAIRNLPPADDFTLQTVAGLAQRLGIKRVPTVCFTVSTLPPMVWAIGTSPVIILPKTLFEGLSRQSQSSILAHELIHIRRRDHLVRLLELTATTVFWWHPVPWYASRAMRDLEEQCCDGQVMELLPGHQRSYATALVDTIEFLSAQHALKTPFPLTAVESVGSLSRRIMMLKNPKSGRLNFTSAFAAMVLVAFPLLLAFAGDPPSPIGSVVEADQNVAIVTGHITDKTGQSLPDALVSIAIPAIEMRFATDDQHRLFQVKTDANGQYELKIPDVTEPTEISIDAASPGYRRSSGTLQSLGDRLRATVEAKKVVSVDASLQAAQYYAGTVVDEQGKPLAGVRIFASAKGPRSTGGMEHTVSDQDGEFEIFNYPPSRAELGQPLQSVLWGIAGFPQTDTRGAVSFTHPDYIDNSIADVYAVAEADRESLRVVMAAGRRVSGAVLNSDGNPVAGVMVKCMSPYPNTVRKAVLSDSEGKFSLQGLLPGPATLSCVDYTHDQKFSKSLTLTANLTELQVKLQPIELPKNVEVSEVLGVKLMDNTEQLAEAYGHTTTTGAFIVSPKPDLFPGGLRKGDIVWMVGDDKVKDTSDTIDRLVAESAKQDGSPARVRVVVCFDRPRMEGTNTQYITLTTSDIESLQAQQPE